MLLDQGGHGGVETNGIRARRGPAFCKSLNERVFGELAVLVVNAGRPQPLNLAGYPVAVPVTASGQPQPATKVDPGDPAVRADPQRRSASHGSGSHASGERPAVYLRAVD